MAERVDYITTEVVRHSLHSAAEQMKRALMRTAFSPIIYDVLDFAVAIYDRDVRLLSQAPGLPNFLGDTPEDGVTAPKHLGHPGATPRS